MPWGGRIFVETATVELDEAYASEHVFVKPGRYVMLSFSDTGCGMDKDTQTHIFEPFFTTKSPGEGTGLGLSTVYGIVKQNDGYVRVYSEPDKGTTFKIYFPAAASTGPVASRTQAPAALRRGSETVLLVEDEDAMRQLARECLEASGYAVLVAPNGEAAIEIAKKHRGSIELVLTDVIMPGISGRELARTLTAIRPEAKILYMSGYPNDLIAQHGLLDPDTILVEKPFTFHSLLTKLRQALGEGVAVHQ
jgi:two-component system, cell cycle sensor histidine kinase and response regulator CckA